MLNFDADVKNTTTRCTNARVAVAHATGVFTLLDARSFEVWRQKIPSLGSMLNFDADVKNDRASPI